MLDKLNLDHALVIDIETVPGLGSFNELSPEFQGLWEHKSKRFIEEDETLAENYFNNAGIYAEFGKVVCISVGFFSRSSSNDPYTFRIRSFSGKDEKTVLENFAAMLTQHFNDIRRNYLLGHNIKEFDVPYLCRRMLVNGLALPKLLDIAGAKPWEVPHVDTMQLWKFGDYKSYTSLKLLAALFDLPTPKDDIDGSDVGRVFWEEDDLQRIAVYCQKDVLTTARLMQRYLGMPVLADEDVTFVDADS